MVSIRLRLIALFVLLVTVTLTVFGVYSQERLSRDLEQRFAERKKEALLRLKTSLPTALWNYDKVQIEGIIQAELEPQEVVSVTVLDDRSNVVATATRAVVIENESAPQNYASNPPLGVWAAETRVVTSNVMRG